MSRDRERELRQTDWHQLLLVWLHDPVNKALAIRRHEVRAARYASGALDQDVSRNEIKDLTSLGDQLAARAERIPMPTAGDKGGGRCRRFRTIVLFRRGELAFLVYGFAKSGRENRRRDELATFRRPADKHLRWSRQASRRHSGLPRPV